MRTGKRFRHFDGMPDKRFNNGFKFLGGVCGCNHDPVVIPISFAREHKNRSRRVRTPDFIVFFLTRAGSSRGSVHR